MSVETRYDETAGEYVLGDTIDGTFVPFASVQATYVETLKQSAANAEQAQQGTPPAEQPTPPPPPPV